MILEVELFLKRHHVGVPRATWCLNTTHPKSNYIYTLWWCLTSASCSLLSLPTSTLSRGQSGRTVLLDTFPSIKVCHRHVFMYMPNYCAAQISEQYKAFSSTQRTSLHTSLFSKLTTSGMPQRGFLNSLFLLNHHPSQSVAACLTRVYYTEDFA